MVLRAETVFMFQKIISTLCFSLLVLVLWSSAEGHVCPQGTCYAGSFSRKEHVNKGRYLLGSSYRNLSSVAGPQACHSACVGDCRCRAFQMSGKRCELLDEDKDSVPSSRFGSDESYEYYDLQQRIVKATSLLNAPADCGNGCCAQHKCLNGGTCVERCKDPKLKFSCNCRPPWSGRFCGKRVYSSCWEKHAFATHNGENLIDGLYTLRTSNGEEFLTYCLFTSAVVWTLIESFAFRYREEFKDKPFFVNYTLPYNPSQPIWEKFRLSRDAMLHVRANSSRFKSECAYNKRDQITGFPKDSILADLSEYDIMQHTEKSGSCVTLETAFIRGQECSSTPCTVSAWHIKNHHLHFDTTSNAQCTYKPTGSVASEDSFGYYFNANPESTCSENDDSTTQWWLGEELL